ncbi:MAG: ABC transporter permease [Candidatus Riflebacteria bacterium]|nr:ABC transporter permease [Candidatus Riflebacteria bacterium]
MLLRLLMISWKEFKQISRDPRMLGITIILPVFMVALYGYGINLDVKHIRIGILDHDRSATSRRLIEAFAHTEYFSIVTFLERDCDIDSAIFEEAVRGVLVIPIHYGRDISRHRSVPVQFVIDGSDSSSANTALGYVKGLLGRISSDFGLETVRRFGIRRKQLMPIENRDRYWYNPELRSANFIVPGLIAVVLMMLSALLTSVTIVREKERGTFESIIGTPVTSFELVIGKLVPYVLISYGDVLLILLISHLFFAVPFRGNLGVLFLLSGVFLSCALGVGLLISARAPSQQIANMGAMVGTQLPAVLLSGFMFPITSMPERLQWIPQLIPASHFIVILRGLFLKGSSLSSLMPQTIALLLFGIAMIVLSAKSFKKKL